MIKSNDKVSELRDLILAELKRLETMMANESKEVYREIHKPAVYFHLDQHKIWIEANYPKYACYFASGSDIIPSNINPILVEVTETWHESLFRLARLTWSLPYSRGYGRRLRFLIMDASNNKLIGIIGMQSPPLDFPARDRLFKYPLGRKVELLNQTMDVFTLGAVPPYNRLLGGKLIALAAASDEVRQAYKRKYDGRKTQMEEITLPSELVALTTTSAFGRSSIYDRLKYQSRFIALSIGYTEGYGSFHLAPLYPMVREFLKQQGIEPRSGFGVGPRAVWQTCKTAFGILGIPKESLKHGIKRETFLFPLIENLQDYMEGKSQLPKYYRQPFQDLADWWRERWLLPRSDRVDGWHSWDNNQIWQTLLGMEADQ